MGTTPRPLEHELHEDEEDHVVAAGLLPEDLHRGPQVVVPEDLLQLLGEPLGFCQTLESLRAVELLEAFRFLDEPRQEAGERSLRIHPRPLSGTTWATVRPTEFGSQERDETPVRNPRLDHPETRTYTAVVRSCPRCARENPPEARFCMACGAALAPGALLTGIEERKVVTVLFCDLVGFTARSDQADPEEIQARLIPYHRRVQQQVERFGGTGEKFIRDAVVRPFGVPTAHEDDPERAVRAALGTLEAIEEMNQASPGLDLAIRIAVNTGEAVVSLGARPEQGEHSVTGDVANTASRLQSVAPVGGVVVGGSTYQATMHLFHYEELEPVRV